MARSRSVKFKAFPEDGNVLPDGSIMWDGELYTVWDDTRTETIALTSSIKGAVKVYLDYQDQLQKEDEE